MTTSMPSISTHSIGFNRIALDSTKCVGVLLWIASLVLIFNVTLIISGTMADSSEFVGALHDNLVVEPHSVALAHEALAVFLYPAALLICFIGFRLAPVSSGRSPVSKSRQPILVVHDNYRQPFVQQFGSRAPPSDK